jgi:hypothetical protein
VLLLLLLLLLLMMMPGIVMAAALTFAAMASAADPLAEPRGPGRLMARQALAKGLSAGTLPRVNVAASLLSGRSWALSGMPENQAHTHTHTHTHTHVPVRLTHQLTNGVCLVSEQTCTAWHMGYMAHGKLGKEGKS